MRSDDRLPGSLPRDVTGSVVCLCLTAGVRAKTRSQGVSRILWPSGKRGLCGDPPALGTGSPTSEGPKGGWGVRQLGWVSSWVIQASGGIHLNIATVGNSAISAGLVLLRSIIARFGISAKVRRVCLACCLSPLQSDFACSNPAVERLYAGPRN